MTTATLDKPEYVIKAPELRGGNLALGACRDREVCLDGPAGSGKTIAALYKLHVLLSTYANTRALIARKSNTALAGSAMTTYRSYILDEREGVYYFGGNKVKPAAFIYPNGSELVVNGLDKPSKVRSTEFDWALINEATECTVEDVEFVHMRLRPRAAGPWVPYRQLMMDCNPDAPTHWLNQRMIEGTTTRLLSRHEDNPRFFDTATQDWTEEGREYIFGILERLTGVRYARYRLGQWAAAEGTVYEDSWDRARNVIDRYHIPAEWPRYLAIDFGFTNPFVCLWAAVDPDGRLVIYRQIYKTKMLVEDHAADIKRYSRWGENGGDPLPRELICDHDAEGRATLERHLGLRTIPAHKSVLDGIQAVATRFRNAGDGKPRIQIMRDCLVERDRELAASKMPTCLEDEPDVYVWNLGPNGIRSKEEPVKEYDHGLDSLRYLTARFDLKPRTVTFSRPVY
jgi:PBSX family phage terminase large subunit